MTLEELSKINKLLRERSELQSWTTNNRLISHAVIVIFAPRSGPGNDRDSIEIEFDLNSALELLSKKIEVIETELNFLGVTL